MSARIDITKCTGCSTCVGICPQNAISIRGGLAVVDEGLCVDCDRCVPVCPVGAISQQVPVNVAYAKGGERMLEHGRGFGFTGSSPPWPYIGRGRGGMPRCWHSGLYGKGGAFTPRGIPTYPPSTVPGDELGDLKDQAAVVKEQLDWMNARIRDFENRE